MNTRPTTRCTRCQWRSRGATKTWRRCPKISSIRAHRRNRRPEPPAHQMTSLIKRPRLPHRSLMPLRQPPPRLPLRPDLWQLLRRRGSLGPPLQPLLALQPRDRVPRTVAVSSGRRRRVPVPARCSPLLSTNVKNGPKQQNSALLGTRHAVSPPQPRQKHCEKRQDNRHWWPKQCSALEMRPPSSRLSLHRSSRSG